MKNKELMKIFNSILKMKGTILFFLIVMINRLICIGAKIGLDTFGIFSIFVGE